MASSDTRPDIIRFGPFELDLVNRELRKRGHLVRLQPQQVAVLLLLVQRAGQVVSREEIHEHIWGNDTFVDFERGINFAINQIRAALGDDAEKPRYVETIPRRGYRFLHPVEFLPKPHDSLEPGKSQPAAADAQEIPPDKKPALGSSFWRKSIFLYLLPLPLIAFMSLWWLVRRNHPPVILPKLVVRSIAVLPFENLSENPDEEYFAQGVTDELITDLAVLPDLRVISRRSTMQYAGTHKPVPQIGRELHVDAIVEGSVVRAGDRVRIRVQLIDASRDQHIWASAYERDISNVLDLEQAAALDIVSELKLQLTSSQVARISKSRTVSPESYDLYLRCRFFWNKRDEDGLKKAIACFNQVIAKDPSYAEAYAGLADAEILLYAYAPSPSAKLLGDARAAAEKAFYLNEDLAEAHTSLAILALYDNDWNWAEAKNHYERALQLNPNYATAHHWYGDAYLVEMGHVDHAIAEIRRAAELDPLSPIIATDLGKAMILARRYDNAITQLNSVIALYPDYALTHYWLFYSYTEKGEYSNALLELDKVQTFLGRPRYLAERAFLTARSGDLKTAQKMIVNVRSLSQREYVNPSAMACAYSAVGNKDQAFVWLERGYQEKLPFMGSIKVYPCLDPLRSDPRYPDLLRRLNLPV